MSLAISTAWRPISCLSGPSIITRTSGSVPDGRIRTRPLPANRASSSLMRAFISSSSRMLSLYSSFTRTFTSTCGSMLILLASLESDMPLRIITDAS